MPSSSKAGLPCSSPSLSKPICPAQTSSSLSSSSSSSSVLAPSLSGRRGTGPPNSFLAAKFAEFAEKQHGRPREVRPDWAHSQFSEVYTIEDQHHDVQVHRPIGHPPGLLRRGGRRPHPHEAAKDSGPRDRGAALEGRGTIHTTDASCQVPMFHGRTNTVAPIAR